VIHIGKDFCLGGIKNKMIKKHICSEHYFHKTIIIAKDIGGNTHSFSVRGNCCSICEKIFIHSEELELLEKRIGVYKELMLIVKEYKNESV